MKAKDLQLAIGKNRILAGHNMVLENVSSFLCHEMDLISVKNRMLYEYEVKISRGDFKADKKKSKYRYFDGSIEMYHNKIPNYFSYVVPVGLITADEIQDYAGLYYVNDTHEISMIKMPKLICKYRHDLDKLRQKVITVYQQRQFLGCCMMTYKNKLIVERENNRQPFKNIEL